MSFIIKILGFFSLLIIVMLVDYKTFAYKDKKEELDYMKDKIYLSPSFIFKSKEYKEFAYVK